MRVKVIKTGEIVDVSYVPVLGQYSVKDGRLFLPQELTFHVPPTETYIDWEQRRYELVKAIIPGILANELLITRLEKTVPEIQDEGNVNIIACLATEYADAVITKLKEK